MYMGIQYHTFAISALDREVSFMPKLFFNPGERYCGTQQTEISKWALKDGFPSVPET